MTIPPEPIATARLDLVPLRVADADEMCVMLADPALYVFIEGRPPTAADLRERYRVQVGGRSADGREEWHNWIVRERSSGAAAGFVQATLAQVTVIDAADDRGDAGERAGRSAEIAWLIGVPWQGRGYATEAVRGLVAWLDGRDVRSIVAHVHDDHHASAAVAARAGLEPTDSFVDGERAWRMVIGANERGPSGPDSATPR